MLTSHDAGWRHLVLEHHHQPPHEVPKSKFQQHILLIFLKDVLVEFKIGDCCEVTNISKGNCLIIPANTDFWKIARRNTEFILIAIEPQHLFLSVKEILRNDEIELIPFLTNKDPFIYGTALALKQGLENDYNNCSLYAELLYSALSIHLCYKHSRKKPQIIGCQAGLSRQQLKQVCEYIQVHLEDDIRLKDIAMSAQINSTYYFCRLFKHSTGVTPYQYLIQQRMELAKQLLKRGDLPIVEIAFSCGFSSQSSFTTSFRKHTGVTPRVYRLQQ